MDNKNLATIKIRNNRIYVPAVLGFLDSLVHQHRKYDLSNYNRLRFVVSEMLTNRIKNAYPNAKGDLFVDISIIDGFLEIAIRDKGVPHWIDLSYNEGGITSDSEDFKKYILSKYIDSAGIEKLGRNGQKVFVRQKIRNPLKFETPAPFKEAVVLDTNISIKPVETEADAIEAIRCIYSEYGYSYAYEKLYYVDNLMRMIKAGEIMCFLAVNDHGQTAGHFALAFSDLFGNMPELSTVVTLKPFRGLGLFAKFMSYAEEIAKEKGFRAIMGQPVAFHPFSQKAFLRSGYTPTSLLLSYINSDNESEYNKDGERLDLFACVKIIDKNAACTIYPPKEIRGFTAEVYKNLGLKAELADIMPCTSESRIAIEENHILSMMRVVIREAGGDIESLIEDAVKNAIRNKHEMIELLISLRSPSCSEAYLAAKDCRFVLSGLLPGGENDDYIVMQLLIKSIRRYDHLVTEGGFEKLTNDIKALAEME